MRKPKLPPKVKPPFHKSKFKEDYLKDGIYDSNGRGVRNGETWEPMSEQIVYALNLAYPVKPKRRKK